MSNAIKSILALLFVVVLALAGWWIIGNQLSTQQQESAQSEEVEGPEHPEADVTTAVVQNIVGIWQSAEDAAFVREFITGGSAVDSYEGKSVSTGSWIVFTEASTPYLQMTMSGAQADVLTFKVTKLTPESLELIYMDRGGVLQFNRIK